MASNAKDLLLYQLVKGLPFYAQVQCSRHRNNGNATLDLPEERTLFLRSLDPALSKDSIARGIASIGEHKLIPVTKQERADGGHLYAKRVYHAVMEDAETASQFIGSDDNPLYTVISAKSHLSKTDETIISTWIKSRRSLYRGMDILQKNADECLMQYDVEADIQNRLDKEVTIDEDGFVLVTSGPDLVKKRKNRSVKRKYEEPITTIDFYRFPNKKEVMDKMKEDKEE